MRGVQDMIVRSLLIMLVLSSLASAFVVLETGVQGRNPAMYGDSVVFEDAAQIKLYDMRKQDVLVLADGHNPSMFGYRVVFHSAGQTPIIKFVDLREESERKIGSVGRNPSIYGNIVAFSAKESELNVDYDNDNSLEDNIILYYNFETETITNTRAVGDNPVVGKNFIIFETSEREYGTDLTRDRDANDVAIRYVTLEDGGVHNTALEGSRPSMTPEGIAAFSDGRIVVLDVNTGEFEKTGIRGQDPWIYDGIVLFAHDGLLASYDIERAAFALHDIPASDPTFFDLAAAFVVERNLRFMRAQDLDQDGLVDFVDNCLQLSNENQTDVDGDGRGDVCDQHDDREGVEVYEDEHIIEKNDDVNLQGEGQAAENESVVAEEVMRDDAKGSTGLLWLLMVLLVPIIGIGVWYGPRWWRKRKKSFGF